MELAPRFGTPAVTALALAGILLGGCINPSPEPPPTPTYLAPGTGYSTLTLASNNTSFSSASFSPNRTVFAACQEDGRVTVWARNGSLVSSWQGHEFGGSGCILRFLDEQSVLVTEYRTLRAFSLAGVQLWQDLTHGDPYGIDGLEVARGGALLMVVHKQGVVQLWDRSANNTTTVQTFSSTNVPDTALAADGSLFAVSSGDPGTGLVDFYSDLGEPVLEVHRNAKVAISSHARHAVVGTASGQHDYVLIDFTGPAPRQTTVAATYPSGQRSSFGYPMPGRAFSSPSGTFFAVVDEGEVVDCAAGSCVQTTDTFTRVIDPSAPSRDLGFGPGTALAMALDDNGSALALSYERISTHSAAFSQTGQLVLTTAAAGATPPLAQAKT